MKPITLLVNNELDIVAARQQGRELAVQIGFSKTDQTLIATAISELARNAVNYGRRGKIEFELVNQDKRSGITIVVTDQGPGIPNVELAMQDGFSTGKSLGMGLPGAKRLMDEFEIKSEVGVGTTITITKWLK
jgi:serine/threonine-protein kinase RsbT